MMTEDYFIVHVDMDAFFASIEQRDNPVLCGKPVVVGSSPRAGKGRGVVSTCSYEARKFGIHSAMPISIAYQRCPHAVFLPVNMEKYESISEQIYQILYDFTPDIERVSIDEAFLDITHSYWLFDTPYNTCVTIKSRIKNKTGLTASIGLAPNKMTAKIASDLKKPDSLVEVAKESILNFLHPLNIRCTPGLGKQSEAILAKMGIMTIGDLARTDLHRLIEIFGKNGLGFWKSANGIDERKIEPFEDAKSVSNEFTFAYDTLDSRKIEATLMMLSEKVSGRLRKDSFKGRTITLKIRTQGFITYTRSITLAVATNFVDIIYTEVKKLYLNFETENKRIRLVGVRVSGLMPADFSDTLFHDKGEAKKENIHRAVEMLKEKFGDRSIYRGIRVEK